MKIGIIGGSGMDDPKLLQDYSEKEIETKYGKPSSKIISGKINNIDVCILARHGKSHEIPPSQVNYRANIAALKLLGCTHILATSAVGSLQEHIHPGDILFPNQFIDFTKQRKTTFYDEIGEVKHEEMASPFSNSLRKILIDTAKELGFKIHEQATLVVIEGPRFSTRSESFMFKNFADIIGMTTVPECTLAKEAGLEYATIAMSTDYDCWKKGEKPVTFEMVMQIMKENADKVKLLILNALPKIPKPLIRFSGFGDAQDTNSTLKHLDIKEIKKSEEEKEFIKSKIRTIPNFPKQGIMFRDITTLFKDPEAMKKTIEIFHAQYKNKNIDIVAGIESRGFIIGGILAEKLNCGFVPIRKKGKLPAETLQQEYQLEYGTDLIEIHKDAIKPNQKVLLIDDLIATSGTAGAACQLIEKLGGNIIECAFIVELEDLQGRKKLEAQGHKVFSIITYEKSG